MLGVRTVQPTSPLKWEVEQVICGNNLIPTGSDVRVGMTKGGEIPASWELAENSIYLISVKDCQKSSVGMPLFQKRAQRQVGISSFYFHGDPRLGWYQPCSTQIGLVGLSCLGIVSLLICSPQARLRLQGFSY